VRKEGNRRSNLQAQVRCRVSNVYIHPEQQSASVLFFGEVRRENQVQCGGGNVDCNVVEESAQLAPPNADELRFAQVSSGR